MTTNESRPESPSSGAASSDAGALAATAHRLDRLAEAGYLDAPALQRARVVAGIAPDAEGWRLFLDAALLVGAGVFLAAAALFFVAYNWAGMGRFAKLGLLESLVVAAAVFAVWRGPSSWPGRASLMAGALLTGGLLAFIGQTYQTGADPWQLFAAWAVLAIPWAAATAWGPSWSLALALANVAAALFFAVSTRWLWWPGLFASAAMALVALNVLALAWAERYGPERERGTWRLLPRLAATAALAAATGAMWDFIFSTGWQGGSVTLAYAAVASAGYAVYRHRRLDVLVLSVLALSLIGVVSAVVARAVLVDGASASGFLLVGLVVIGLSAAAARWLRGVSAEESR